MVIVSHLSRLSALHTVCVMDMFYLVEFECDKALLVVDKSAILSNESAGDLKEDFRVKVQLRKKHYFAKILRTGNDRLKLEEEIEQLLQRDELENKEDAPDSVRDGDSNDSDVPFAEMTKRQKIQSKPKTTKVQRREQEKEVLAAQVPLTLARPPSEQTTGTYISLLFIELN